MLGVTGWRYDGVTGAPVNNYLPWPSVTGKRGLNSEWVDDGGGSVSRWGELIAVTLGETKKRDCRGSAESVTADLRAFPFTLGW